MGVGLSCLANLWASQRRLTAANDVPDHDLSLEGLRPSREVEVVAHEVEARQYLLDLPGVRLGTQFPPRASWLYE